MSRDQGEQKWRCVIFHYLCFCQVLHVRSARGQIHHEGTNLLPPFHNIRHSLTNVRHFLTLVYCQKTSYIMGWREYLFSEMDEQHIESTNAGAACAWYAPCMFFLSKGCHAIFYSLLYPLSMCQLS